MPDKRIAEIHAQADRVVATCKKHTAAKGEPVTCSAGCSSCCKEPVYADSREVQNMISLVPAQDRPALVERTRAWLDAVQHSPLFGQHLPSAFAWRLLGAQCPFLVNNLCSVYEARPIGCRLFLAVGSPERCKSEELRPSQVFVSTEGGIRWIMGVATYKLRSLNHDHLGVWLAHILLGESTFSGSHLAAGRDEIKATAVYTK